jgi:hypothetical protein
VSTLKRKKKVQTQIGMRKQCFIISIIEALKYILNPGMVEHANNPSTQDAEVEDCEFKATWTIQ